MDRRYVGCVPPNASKGKWWTNFRAATDSNDVCGFQLRERSFH